MTSIEHPDTFILGFCACNCGQEIEIKQTGQNYLKRFAPHHQKRGNDSPYYKNGKTVDAEGYIRVLCPDHPYANNRGRVREHRLVMEKHLGRYLEPYEKIHHINGIKTDNRIENLLLYITQKEHFQNHKTDMSNRRCKICNTDKTRKHSKNNHLMWFHYDKNDKKAGFICSYCYDKRRDRRRKI